MDAAGVGRAALVGASMGGPVDHPDILAIAERLERALPDAASARIPAAAHLPSLERPGAVDAVVAPFLAKTPT